MIFLFSSPQKGCTWEYEFETVGWVNNVFVLGAAKKVCSWNNCFRPDVPSTYLAINKSQKTSTKRTRINFTPKNADISIIKYFSPQRTQNTTTSKRKTKAPDRPRSAQVSLLRQRWWGQWGAARIKRFVELLESDALAVGLGGKRWFGSWVLFGFSWVFILYIIVLVMY